MSDAITLNADLSVNNTLDADLGVNTLDTNYQNQASMDALLSALGSALGFTWSKAYDSTLKKYTYTITATSASESIGNKVTTISSSSTDVQYPSAKCVYDVVGTVEASLETLL